ncbi:MAG: hypothetical protein KIS92_18195 [Planctomycetota bacterium]|nr:hypothetical protein [Planctomycetota bacterium]
MVSPAPADERERVWADDLNTRMVSLALGGTTYDGYLVPPPTESTFRFKLAETGDVVEFRWSTLAEPERRRVQALFGIRVEDGRLSWGEKVRGTRWTLKSGKSLAGLECPERALPGRRCLKTSSSLFFVDAKDVEREDPADLRESDVCTAKEYYERKLLERPPGKDPTEHERLARICVQTGLYEKAVEHLEIEALLDPRSEERVRPLRVEAARLLAEQIAERLYLGLRADLRGGDFASALRKIDAMARNFSQSEFRTRAEALRGEAEEGFQASYKQQVVQMYYHQTIVLIRERMAKRLRIDQDGRPVPVEPGKQVTTVKGHLFRGRLLEDAEDHVTLNTGDLKVRIARKEILAMADCDLGEAAGSIPPTYADLKAYVTSKEGLGKDLAERIATLLKLDVKQVQDTWESRFNALATYEDGVLTKTPIFTVRQTANFGSGSWLCDGAAGIVEAKFGARPRPPQARAANDDAEHPEASDDPEVWWKTRPAAQQAEILRALAGMRLFRVKEFLVRPCPECGGQGFHEILTPDGKMDVICLTCRGLQVHIKVDYE